MNKIEMMEITSQRILAPRIYELTLKGEMVQQMDEPGQFLNLLVPRADLLLRRPISINHIDKAEGTCRIIYRVEGDGTAAFAQMQAGEKLNVMGPLGKGFSYSKLNTGDVAYIIGGGIGIPPLYELSKQLVAKGIKPIHFLGYASNEVKYYEEEFRALGETHIATDDGSYGVHGHVGYLFEHASAPADAVFSCGSNGLLRAVENEFLGKVEHVQLSLEARMACGMGACYACVNKLRDDETGLKSVKVCDEGPVFPAGKVVL